MKPVTRTRMAMVEVRQSQKLSWFHPQLINRWTFHLLYMHNLDLDGMHASEFFEYANIGMIGMEYSSRKSIIAVIRSYTISRGVDYVVYEFEPQTFYTKCKTYGRGCNWLT
ncbi:hypothetical protein Ahy_B06g080386 [Arachis hypogaea]|uniref:Transposase MuDR plant domain-containing protein n=1 Tax=Arachis hypogaea TaxID=3818 RepID=A0A444YHS7_ARAHY|nr:hypothetical protein Ahy_B06g080386 [Arachis hypogaea]